MINTLSGPIKHDLLHSIAGFIIADGGPRCQAIYNAFLYAGYVVVKVSKWVKSGGEYSLVCNDMCFCVGNNVYQHAQADLSMPPRIYCIWLNIYKW